MAKRNLLIAVLAIATALTTGCIKRHGVSEAALTKLTSAVQGEVMYGPADPTGSQEEILATVYRENPELKTEFRRFIVHTQRAGEEVLVLVCSHDGKIGLLEDSSSTPYVDRNWIKSKPRRSCSWDSSLDQRSTAVSR